MLAGVQDVPEIPRHVCEALSGRSRFERSLRGSSRLISAAHFPESLSGNRMKETLNVTGTGWHRLRFRQSVGGIPEQQILIRQKVAVNFNRAGVARPACFGEGAPIHVRPFTRARLAVQNAREHAVQVAVAYRVVGIDNIDELPKGGFSLSKLLRANVLPHSVV